MIESLWQAISMAVTMGWEILWALILGFALSGAIQAVVSHKEMGKLFPDDSPRSIAIACGLGAASSSCSYAATAITRAVFRKGGDFTAAMAFELASTNLVLELGIILWVLIGWQFTLAEFVGAPLMIAIMAFLFRLFLSKKMIGEAKAVAERGVAGKMEGHAAMDMSLAARGPIWRRILSAEGFTAISHFFFMDVASLWLDLVIGLLIAGALAAWVPQDFWQGFFLSHDPFAAKLVGPLIGPLVAMVAFVCSIGNVPLAAVLWAGGASFGAVIAFIFADLIVLPILDIYRRYYGVKMSAFIFVTFYAAMVGAAYLVEIIFGALGLVPGERSTTIMDESIRWNYTSVLDIVFGLLAALLLWRFLKTGGPAMLRMMSAPAHGGHEHHHHDHHHHHH
jgi:hypothetical protein